ncbi:MAG: ATP-binding protein [Lysobacterales bacterium]
MTERWTCPDHGEYGADRFSVDWRCPDCERAANAALQAYRGARHRYAHWRDRSGIPPRYRSAISASIQPVSEGARLLRQAVETITSNIAETINTGRGLVLMGPPGVGKTLALAAMVNAACSTTLAVYASWPDTVAKVKAAISSKSKDRDLIDTLIAAPLLALDEIGVKALSDWEHNELFRLVDSRYAECRPTLIASNVMRDAWANAVGERIADRLRECGPTLAITGESQRGRIPLSGPDAVQPPPRELVVRVHEHGRWKDVRHELD